jgi:glycogen debranching enzyme
MQSSIAGSANPVGPGVPAQPWLHELSSTVNGNVAALSSADGQIRHDGAQGVFVDDSRILSILTIALGDHEPVAIAANSSGARAEFLSSARTLGNPGPDPTIEVRRIRELVAHGTRETVHITSRADHRVDAELLIAVGGDAAQISAVKAGMPENRLLDAAASSIGVTWESEWHRVLANIDPPPAAVVAGTDGRPSIARVAVSVKPGQTSTVTVTVTATRSKPSSFDADAGAAVVAWDEISIRATDPRLEPTMTASIDDLRHLLMTDPEDPDDVFAAAGAPWYLTLFGRDSLWAARMMLPFGTRLAAGTLRALARRQGRIVDAGRAEAPGKIPHELRRSEFVDPVSGLALPTAYYGTVDATALWITVLRDAWRWGMAASKVEALLPNLRFAVRWMLQTAASHPDGLLTYAGLSDHGLSNQGWKDSGDAIRHHDGTIAAGPIALIEAQAYAVEAAQAAAELYDAFNLTGSEELRDWATTLSATIRNHFWTRTAQKPHRSLSMAVNGHGAAVDGLASNMGHALGTGVLSSSEVDLVAADLTSPDLLSSYGIRTLAQSNAGFNPIGYHTGSIWTHDTAIGAWGLAREGRRDHAAQVAQTLLASAEAFRYRWPELYAGTGVANLPAPYPASCRPQAWSAASAATLISVALGFEPDAPNRKLTLRPARPAIYGDMTAHGLEFAGSTFGVHCAADGTTDVLDPPLGIEITII